MKWSSAVSERETLTDAFAECADKVLGELGGLEAHLIAAFVSPHYSAEYGALPALAAARFGDALLCGLQRRRRHRRIHRSREPSGFALTAAHMPGVSLTPFHIGDEGLPDGDAPPDEWGALTGTPIGEEAHFLLLADPFSVQGEQLLMGLDYAFPYSVKIGGLASGAQQPGGNALYLGGDVYTAAWWAWRLRAMWRLTPWWRRAAVPSGTRCT